MSREEIHTKSIIEKNELVNKPFYKRQWVKEIFIFLVALLVYQVSRALAIGDADIAFKHAHQIICLLYTSPSPRDATLSRMPSSA